MGLKRGLQRPRLAVAIAGVALLPLTMILVPLTFEEQFGPPSTERLDAAASACIRAVQLGHFASAGEAAAWLLIFWGAAGLALMLIRIAVGLVRQLTLSRRLSRISDQVEVFAGGEPIAVHVLNGPGGPGAFVAGFGVPRIYLSAELLRSAPQVELEAVLCHERSHVRRRDPLRCWLADAVCQPLFPGTRRLAAGYRAQCECEADRQAVLVAGGVEPLLSAMKRFAAGGHPVPSCGFADIREPRLAAMRMLGGPQRASVLPLAGTLGALAVSLIIVVAGAADWAMVWRCPPSSSSEEAQLAFDDARTPNGRADRVEADL